MGTSSERFVAVNIMIDAELSPFAQNASSEEKWSIELDSLSRMLDEINSRGLNATIYLTGEFIVEQTENASYGDFSALVASEPNHELAIHGMTTSEKLGTLPYEMQLSLLSETRMLLEEICVRDGEPFEVKGFRPQYFSQNESTYNILDEMGIEYDSGYKDGLLYVPGHENDSWPYMVENHTFYAVPISTHSIDGTMIYLCDFSSKHAIGLNGTQWSDLLIDEFDECAERGDPMVVIFHNFIAGEDEEYMDAFVRFLDYVVSENAVTLTTAGLVELSEHGRPLSELAPDSSTDAS